MKALSIQEKQIITGRLVFGFAFCCLLFRFLMYATPSHLLQPVLKSLSFDYTYWLYQLLYVPHLILKSKTGSILFDILLLLSCLLSFLFPLKRIYAIFFGLLFFIYLITVNTYTVAHSHQLTIMSLISVPFFCCNSKYWLLLWKGMRYYICSVYTMAFVWKAFIGKALWFWDQGINSAYYNLAEYLYYFPQSHLASVYRWIMARPFLLNSGFVLITLLEGAFLIGFFTRKWDHLLIVFIVVIHAGTYLFSDVFFLEFLVGIVPFLKDEHLKKLAALSVRKTERVKV